jgi:hypothetical protein
MGVLRAWTGDRVDWRPRGLIDASDSSSSASMALFTFPLSLELSDYSSIG